MMTEWSADTIRALRERLGLDRREFAAMLYCDAATIWRWETGKIKPRPAYRQALEQRAKELAEGEERDAD